MYKKERHSQSTAESVRLIGAHDPTFFSYALPEPGVVSTPGSVYLGDARSEGERLEMDELGECLDIIDLRSAPVDRGGRIYGDQVFDASVNFLIVQDGVVDWGAGVGFKGLREGESVTIGRHDPVSSQRFKLSNQVSRKHVTLYATEQGIAIEDEGSANGTSYVGYDTPRQAMLRSAHEAVPTIGETEVASTELLAGRAMSEELVYQWDDYLRSAMDIQIESVRHLRAEIDFIPVTGLELDGMNFLFSEVFTVKSRKAAIAYVSGGETPGVLRPRLFYQSKSDGGWRATPGIENDGTYSKGGAQYHRNLREEYGGYVQITKPSEAIVAILERQSRLQEQRHAGRTRQLEFDELESFMNVNDINEQQAGELADEVTLTYVQGRNVDAYVSGVGYKNAVFSHPRINPREVPLREALQSMELPDGFEPDFTHPPKGTYRTSHTLLGEVQVEVFAAQLEGRPIDWHIARDTEVGRVWVDRIVYQDSKVTSYGTQREVILAGALSSKPLDYDQQQGCMEAGRDYTEYSKVYADVSGVLNKIPAIARYRAARGIHQNE